MSEPAPADGPAARDARSLQGAEQLAARVLERARSLPLVCVSTRPGSDEAWLDADVLAARLAGRAEVWLLRDGPPSRRLAELLPEGFAIYGGHLRIWWSGVDPGADPLAHPIFFIRRREEIDEKLQRLETALEDWEVRARGRRGATDPPPSADGQPPRRHDATGAGSELERLLHEERERTRDALAQLAAERTRSRGLEDRLRDEQARARTLRRELRAARDELAARTAPERDPLADESSLLAAVRSAWKRMYTSDDREAFPLRRIELDDEFLPSARTLEGVDRERIVEVCAHVASGRAWHIAGLAVHPLRTGPGGTPQRTRPGGASAWRCALQVGSPSARRLHWWQVPGPGGGTVEFWRVGTHDDGIA